ncbi:hypothetical protein A4H97_03380 [Niastella yeongjuensis]|uniref:Uncharacterized protein n=1 Tax=Niastella yeongjuensis TaxID=354355 RepID=A0A1V9EXN9_9BACT|nr:hypothetical protein [Niastella yeongjuensis]OQP50880.1 hypothetical protein A4H97_03380 [Niastella yeongjuensis]SEN13382.1 hypothetical protein SAMN05660816_00264 [Niastella yeongjuensis]
MRSEEQCKPLERYLYVDSRWSEAAIEIWQKECIKRLATREKDSYYDKFINWKSRENEIAVFTLYAYADFPIPKRFDCIFQIGNPEIYINTEFQLTQSVWEGWFPIGNIDHGHKHLVVLEFVDKVPDIFNSLHLENNRSSTVPKPHLALGLCQFSDLTEITK